MLLLAEKVRLSEQLSVAADGSTLLVAHVMNVLRCEIMS